MYWFVDTVILRLREADRVFVVVRLSHRVGYVCVEGRRLTIHQIIAAHFVDVLIRQLTGKLHSVRVRQVFQLLKTQNNFVTEIKLK